MPDGSGSTVDAYEEIDLSPYANPVNAIVLEEAFDEQKLHTSLTHTLKVTCGQEDPEDTVPSKQVPPEVQTFIENLQADPADVLTPILKEKCLDSTVNGVRVQCSFRSGKKYPYSFQIDIQQ